jgi:hypothetical protein
MGERKIIYLMFWMNRTPSVRARSFMSMRAGIFSRRQGRRRRIYYLKISLQKSSKTLLSASDGSQRKHPQGSQLLEENESKSTQNFQTEGSYRQLNHSCVMHQDVGVIPCTHSLSSIVHPQEPLKQQQPYPIGLTT